MTPRHFLTLLIFASLALFAPTPGFAQGDLPELVPEEEVSGWRIRGYNILDVDQRNVAAAEREIEYSGVMAWTANSEAPGIMFTCNEKGALGATFSVAPVDFGDPAVMNAKSRIKVLKGRLIVDGDKPASKQQFLLRRKLNVIQAMNINTGYTAINAIYNKKSLRLEVDGQDAVDYDLPPVDDELKEFVANCPGFKQAGD